MSHTHPAVEPPLTAEQLPDDLATLKNMILELLVSMHQPRPRPSGDAASTGKLLLASGGCTGARRTLQLPINSCSSPTFRRMRSRRVPRRPARRSPSGSAGRMVAAVCRRILPRVPKHHELTEPLSGSVLGYVAISAKRSASTPASSWITNRRRCSSSSTLSTSTPVYAVARPRQQALPAGTAGSGRAAANAGRRILVASDAAGGGRRARSHEHTQRVLVAGASADGARSPEAIDEPRRGEVPAPRDHLPRPSRRCRSLQGAALGQVLLAHLIVSASTSDHLPLYRLENIYERQGLFLPTFDVVRLAAGLWPALLRPLYDRLVVTRQDAAVAGAAHRRYTAEKTTRTRRRICSARARMWAYLGDAAHPYNVFDFTLNRRRDEPAAVPGRLPGDTCTPMRSAATTACTCPTR